MRVIVTGSRDWPWPNVVCDDLTTLALECRDKVEEFRLFFGDCLTGPDAFAYQWTDDNDDLVVGYKRFAADWTGHGKAAGPIRNRQMIDYVKAMSETDKVICLAYRLNGSRGTTHCMDTAYSAGFEMRLWDLYRTVVPQK